jgi:hypothetical protein
MNTSGLCAILMNGEDVTLLFAMPACEYFQKKIIEGSIMVDDEGNTVGDSSLAFLLYAGYWNNCIANGRAPKLKIGDFLEWIEVNVDDEQVQQQLLTVAEAFRDSQSVERYKKRTEKQTEELKKKIATLSGELLNPSATENLDSAPTSTGG